MHVYIAGLGYSYDGTGLTVPEYLVREAFSKQNLIKKNNGVSPWVLSTFFLLMHLFSTGLLEFFSLENLNI
jgi:hypothetical protein